MVQESHKKTAELYFSKVRRVHVRLHNQLASNFKRSHFILNVGAMSALTAYILSGDNKLQVGCAILAFLLGMLFSIYSIILDYFYGYLRLSYFDKNFSELVRNNKKIIIEKKKLHLEYEKNNSKYERQSILLRVFNGLIAYLFFIIGIMSIIFKNISSDLAVTMKIIVIVFITYVIISAYFLFHVYVLPQLHHNLD